MRTAAAANADDTTTTTTAAIVAAAEHENTPTMCFGVFVFGVFHTLSNAC